MKIYFYTGTPYVAFVRVPERFLEILENLKSVQVGVSL